VPQMLHKHASMLCCVYISRLVLSLLVVAVVLAVNKFSFKEVFLKSCLHWLSYSITLWNLPIVKQVITLLLTQRDIQCNLRSFLYLVSILCGIRGSDWSLYSLAVIGSSLENSRWRGTVPTINGIWSFRLVSPAISTKNWRQIVLLHYLHILTRLAQFILCVI